MSSLWEQANAQVEELIDELDALAADSDSEDEWMLEEIKRKAQRAADLYERAAEPEEAADVRLMLHLLAQFWLIRAESATIQQVMAKDRAQISSSLIENRSDNPRPTRAPDLHRARRTGADALKPFSPEPFSPDRDLEESPAKPRQRDPANFLPERDEDSRTQPRDAPGRMSGAASIDGSKLALLKQQGLARNQATNGGPRAVVARGRQAAPPPTDDSDE